MDDSWRRIWNIYQYSPELKKMVDKTIIFNKFSRNKITKILMRNLG